MNVSSFNSSNKQHSRCAFTLVEIMIVVVIIGLLVALALPAFSFVRERTIANRVGSDLRTFANGFEIYGAENGGFPDDLGPGVLPNEMRGYINESVFESETPAGGRYDWDNGQFGYRAGVSVWNPTVDDDVMLKLDRAIDDGVLSSGIFRSRAGGFIYIIEF